MTTQNTISEQYCSTLINHAKSVLTLSKKEVISKFPNNAVHATEPLEKKKHGSMLEITSNSHVATLTCTFNEQDKCCTSHVFFNNPEEINQCIIYLCDKYDYDFIKGSWLLHNCYLQIVTTNEDVSFVLHK